MSDKPSVPVPPVVLVTRKLPDAVEDRLGRDYQARKEPAGTAQETRGADS